MLAALLLAGAVFPVRRSTLNNVRSASLPVLRSHYRIVALLSLLLALALSLVQVLSSLVTRSGRAPETCGERLCLRLFS
jgi:hypothetical protein